VNDAAKSIQNKAKDNNSPTVEQEEVLITTDLKMNTREMDLYKT